MQDLPDKHPEIPMSVQNLYEGHYRNSSDQVLTFISIRHVHTLATHDTWIASTPHPNITCLSNIVEWTGTDEVIPLDHAFSSIQAWSPLQKVNSIFSESLR